MDLDDVIAGWAAGAEKPDGRVPRVSPPPSYPDPGSPLPEGLGPFGGERRVSRGALLLAALGGIGITMIAMSKRR